MLEEIILKRPDVTKTIIIIIIAYLMKSKNNGNPEPKNDKSIGLVLLKLRRFFKYLEQHPHC
jgi:hypothetical protein